MIPAKEGYQARGYELTEHINLLGFYYLHACFLLLLISYRYYVGVGSSEDLFLACHFRAPEQQPTSVTTTSTTRSRQHPSKERLEPLSLYRTRHGAHCPGCSLPLSGAMLSRAPWGVNLFPAIKGRTTMGFEESGREGECWSF